MKSIEIDNYKMIGNGNLISIHSHSTSSMAGYNIDLDRADISMTLAVTSSKYTGEFPVKIHSVQVLFPSQTHTGSYYSQSMMIPFPSINKKRLNTDNITLSLISIDQADFREKTTVDKYINFEDIKF
jgi:hypothetical protein